MNRKLKKKYKESINQTWHQPAQIIVGKNGLSTGVINEISERLEKQSFLKVKFLRNFLTDDFEKSLEKLSRETNAKILDKRGRTVILFRSTYKQ
ncbi:MAG: YhbY family RNA-binding protein [Asgard group archaeon]|nr:YhbY family RNA-binding protein [Asgard group archaeon]